MVVSHSSAMNWQFVVATCGCAPLTVFPNQVYGFATRTAWFSHELSAASTVNGPLQWIGGVYFYDETDDNPQYEAAPQQAQLNSPVDLTGAPAAPSHGGGYLFLDYQDHIQSWAGYAQLDYKLTGWLSAGVGYQMFRASILDNDGKIGNPFYSIYQDSMRIYLGTSIDIDKLYLGLSGQSEKKTAKAPKQPYFSGF